VKDESNRDPNTWAGVVADLIVQFGGNQSALARRIGVSQQTVSAWLAGGVDAPSIQTVRAVYQISGDSMLRLISIAYGWPLQEIAQRAVLDAAIVDEALTTKNRKHIVYQYGVLLRDSQSARAAGAAEDENNHSDSV
jgi:transcriptional regulator with XRE-family HTH domain